MRVQYPELEINMMHIGHIYLQQFEGKVLQKIGGASLTCEQQTVLK